MKYVLEEKEWSKAVQPWAEAFLADYKFCMSVQWTFGSISGMGNMSIGDSKRIANDKIDEMRAWAQDNLPSASFAIEGERRTTQFWFFTKREYMMLFKLAFA